MDSILHCTVIKKFRNAKYLLRDLSLIHSRLLTEISFSIYFENTLNFSVWVFDTQITHAQDYEGF